MRHPTVAVLTTVGGLMLALLACLSAGAAQPEPSRNENAPAATVKLLDFRTPDVTRLVSPEELERLARGTLAEEREIDEVQVQRRSALPPDRPPVWTGLLAPFWALAHPTQAWRIFAPLPSDQVKPGSK